MKLNDTRKLCNDNPGIVAKMVGLKSGTVYVENYTTYPASQIAMMLLRIGDNEEVLGGTLHTFVPGEGSRWHSLNSNLHIEMMLGE